MTNPEAIKALLTETESLWRAALVARRAAAAKERKYKETLRKWLERGSVETAKVQEKEETE